MHVFNDVPKRKPGFRMTCRFGIRKPRAELIGIAAAKAYLDHGRRLRDARNKRYHPRARVIECGALLASMVAKECGALP